MSTEPEGVQDLLEQDATMWEGDDAEEDDNMRQNRQDQAGGAGAQTQANGKAGKRLPVPAPRKGGPGQGAGQAGGAKAPHQGAQQQRQQPLRQQPAGGAGAGAAAPQGRGGGRQPHRYFILKSKSLFNVDQSVEKGIWATQVG
jgi:hypothetical protein